MDITPQFTVQEIDGQQIYITDLSNTAVEITEAVDAIDLQNAVLLTTTDQAYDEDGYQQFIIDWLRVVIHVYIPVFEIYSKIQINR